MPGAWIAPRNWSPCAMRWRMERRPPKRCESVFPALRRQRSHTNLACRSRRRTTTRWSVHSGDLRNTGNGRHASCCTAAGSRPLIEYWSAPTRNECSGKRHRKTSLWRMSCSITPKRSERPRRSRGATGRPCSRSAAGTGAPALSRSQRSRLGLSRNLCSTCPATPECWIWWRLMSFPSEPVHYLRVEEPPECHRLDA